MVITLQPPGGQLLEMHHRVVSKTGFLKNKCNYSAIIMGLRIGTTDFADDTDYRFDISVKSYNNLDYGKGNIFNIVFLN
jgi:hypothetical protein